jgi:hypothetical protein
MDVCARLGLRMTPKPRGTHAVERLAASPLVPSRGLTPDAGGRRLQPLAPPSVIRRHPSSPPRRPRDIYRTPETALRAIIGVCGRGSSIVAMPAADWPPS